MNLVTKENKNFIREKWLEFAEERDITPPKIYFCLHSDIWYLTISDNTTIYKFLSLDGKGIYAAAKSNCDIIKENGIRIYLIEEFDELQIITCRSFKDEKGIFAKENIVKNLK